MVIEEAREPRMSLTRQTEVSDVGGQPRADEIKDLTKAVAFSPTLDGRGVCCNVTAP